ncbi:periplasmic heavy metal sensor, partial [Congregibacter sp.]|uniref:periplasmic heavy metal sensor n=1 Tax=Congregibacter sp. TaxID=2744308 RepID=UPI00385895CC
MAWAAEHLSPETKRRLRGQMRAQLSEVRPLREDMRNAQMAVREAAAAEEYDPQVLALALERSRQISERYQALIHRNLVEVSAELPKDQRIALARAALQRGQNAKMPSRPPQHNR